MEEVCKELGLSMTTAFTLLAKKMRREKRIPFEVSIDPFYSDSNISYLHRIASEVDSGQAKLAEHPPHNVKRKSLTLKDFFLPRHWEFQQTSPGYRH
jgi:DNA-damage-inducible protein J